MLNTELVTKSEKDRVPTLNTAPLIKAGLLSRKPKNGERVDVRLVNSAGIVAEQDFYGSRDGSTIYAKNGFNSYLFDLPKLSKPTKVGVCEANFSDDDDSYTSEDFDTGRGHAVRTRVTSAPTSLTALNRLVSEYGSKTAAAESLGVSPRTFGRMFEKAQAAEASSKRSSGRSQASKSGRFGSQKKASPAATKSSSRSNTYGKTNITKTALKQALKGGNSNAAAADLLGWSSDTIRRAKEFFGL